jgi:hypothetical protein
MVEVEGWRGPTGEVEDGNFKVAAARSSTVRTVFLAVHEYVVLKSYETTPTPPLELTSTVTS